MEVAYNIYISLCGPFESPIKNWVVVGNVSRVLIRWGAASNEVWIYSNLKLVSGFGICMLFALPSFLFSHTALLL
jgi:hypothetical protein